MFEDWTFCSYHCLAVIFSEVVFEIGLVVISVHEEVMFLLFLLNLDVIGQSQLECTV